MTPAFYNRAKNAGASKSKNARQFAPPVKFNFPVKAPWPIVQSRGLLRHNRTIPYRRNQVDGRSLQAPPLHDAVLPAVTILTLGLIVTTLSN